MTEQTPGTPEARSGQGAGPGAGPEDAGAATGPVAGPLAGAVTGAAYGMLFLLGVVVGVVGAFHHSWYIGDVPVAALAWLVILFAVPYGMGRLLGGKSGAVVPAVGWLVASFPLANRLPAGDLAIAGDLSGFCYLYGGVVAVAAAVFVTKSSGSWLLRSYGGPR